jgi:hypothetical protein
MLIAAMILLLGKENQNIASMPSAGLLDRAPVMAGNRFVYSFGLAVPMVSQCRF